MPEPRFHLQLPGDARYTPIQLCSGKIYAVALPHPLPDDLVELIARRLRLIAEPTRIRLLDQLRDGEQSVNSLAAAMGAGQQNVSKHLTALAEAGVLARRKDGNHVYYRIADASVLGLCEQVCGSLEQQLHALTATITGSRPSKQAASRPAHTRTPSQVVG
jgi:DNA-binding transcriptional ArsR family regulator